MITLTPKNSFKVPIDGGCITPDVLAAKSLSEISYQIIWEGNRKRLLSELFDIKLNLGKSSDAIIRVIGDVSKVRRLGAKMTQGEIIVEGDAGMHIGEEMNGGKITVLGNAGSWAGSMIRNGTIIVKGNVDDYLAAPYRGLTAGMKGGTIVVEGNAGNEVGCFMTGGTIHVRGSVGLFAGMHMHGGTLVIESDAEGRVGAEMTGGRIVVLGKIASILPSFIVDEMRSSVRVGEERLGGPFYVFKGDVTESWSGSLFVAAKNNPHLKGCEAKIV